MDGDKLGDANTIAVTNSAKDPFDQEELHTAVAITIAAATNVVTQLYFLNNEWIDIGNPYDDSISGTITAGTSISFEPSYVAVSNPSGKSDERISYITLAPTEPPMTVEVPVVAFTNAPTSGTPYVSYLANACFTIWLGVLLL